MDLRVDRNGVIVSMSTTFSDVEFLQVGVLKPLDAFPKKFDITVGLGGDPLERNERRYRGEVDEGYYLTGIIETKREKRVVRRGEFEGQFMRSLIGGGRAPLRTDSDFELISKEATVGDLMDALAGAINFLLIFDVFRLFSNVFRLSLLDLSRTAFGKRPSGQAKWPLDSNVSKNDEFCIQNEKLCIKNEESCITNEELCVQK